jgi:hypothetical protein
MVHGAVRYLVPEYTLLVSTDPVLADRIGDALNNDICTGGGKNTKKITPGKE